MRPSLEQQLQDMQVKPARTMRVYKRVNTEGSLWIESWAVPGEEDAGEHWAISYGVTGYNVMDGKHEYGWRVRYLLNDTGFSDGLPSFWELMERG